jgi:hypothetical protein
VTGCGGTGYCVHERIKYRCICKEVKKELAEDVEVSVGNGISARRRGKKRGVGGRDDLDDDEHEVIVKVKSIISLRPQVLYPLHLQ